MTLSERALNRATLARQLLLERHDLSVPAATRRLLALQAQNPASPYLALWNRLDAFDPAALDAAFEGRTLVKATLLRITLHAVHVDDYPQIHSAMQPTLRAARLNDRRFASSGLSREEADALVPRLSDFLRQPRSAAEAEAWVAEQTGVPAKWVWWALRQYGPVLHAPTGAPWSFGTRPAYVATTAPPHDGTAEAALQALARRYLEAFGPASAADFAQYAPLHRGRAHDALQAVAETLVERRGPGGRILYDVSDGPLPDEDLPAPPRLLPMWDNLLLGHADRGRVIPPEYRTLVARSNGDVLPTLLVDGFVAGVWRPVEHGIEATAFRPLPDDVWDALREEAASLRALLADREPMVYQRHHRWWDGLPAAEVRLL